jgi:hypothetical protein
MSFTQQEENNILLERRLRGAAANAFIEVVANCGLEYFKHKHKGSLGHIAAFEVDGYGTILFRDPHSGHRVKASLGNKGAFQRFFEGKADGPIQIDLASQLSDYVLKGVIPQKIELFQYDANSRNLVSEAGNKLVSIYADEKNKDNGLQFVRDAAPSEFKIAGMGGNSNPGDDQKRREKIVADANALAAKFYLQFDCQASAGYKFYEATHPQEVLVWNMACVAYGHINEVDVHAILEELQEDEAELREAEMAVAFEKTSP